MEKKISQNVFNTILSQVFPLIKNAGNSIKDDESTYNLSFVPFTINFLFGIICNIKTRAQLITQIRTSDIAQALNLVNASNSSYTEAFYRYDSKLFREIFIQLLSSLSFMSIPGLDQLGMFMLVDGSIFPAVKSMTWASYKKTANALKLHLAFNLNKMIPAEFITADANYSERKFLKDILKEGITYICDRGYLCLKTFKAICDKGAFFIIRSKSNLKHVVRERLVVDLPANIIGLLQDVKDMRIVFKNDKNRDKNNKKIEYRMITFTAMGEFYTLITNRFDLTTYEIIMLYAYRWQIELIFRFLKRTQNCIHLLCHEPNGIEIQFYLYMIAYLLLLSFKQKCAIIESGDQIKEDIANPADNEIQNESFDYAQPEQGRYYARGLVSMLGKGLQKYWKISIHWLIVIRNYMLKPFTESIAKAIALE